MPLGEPRRRVAPTEFNSGAIYRGESSFARRTSMHRLRSAVEFAIIICLALAPGSAQAFFHTWRFTEFFSSDDGSVQFIEMGTGSNFENQSNGATITSQSTGKTFTFNSNLSTTSTAGRRLLIATPGFELLPGAV